MIASAIDRAFDDILRAPDSSSPIHIVIEESWPVALCGYEVTRILDSRGRDRCADCLSIARAKGYRLNFRRGS